ncbi:MAG: amidase family protein [Firmicutes bacterium]|nr:amidase family protein [Bacillota bacterium]
MKKFIIILVIVLGIIAIAIATMFAFMKSSVGDQIVLQYDEVPDTPYKLNLDTSDFDNAISNKRYNALSEIIPYGDIEEIQNMISKNQISIEELVSFYGKRISKLDREYNSVIRLNENALREARKEDENLKNGAALRELTGVIILVKDNVSVKGMNTSAGSYALKELKTDRSSFVVKSLQEKGAIILGKVNLSEFSNFMSMPSSNGFSTLGGQTKNAYGKYDVGGSSSGSSVAASLGFSTITIGSETSGSLIYPAGQNSVVAIKPSLGLVSRDLVIPISEAQDTLGYIGRNVKDVYKVFKYSLSKDENDPLSQNYDLLDENELNIELNKSYIQGKRLGILNDGSDEINKVIGDLKGLGCEVVEIQMSDELNSIDMMTVLSYGIKHDLNNYLQNPAVKSPHKNLEAIIAFNNIDDTRAPYGQYYLELGQGNSTSKDEYESIVKRNREISSEWIDKTLEENKIDYLVSMSNALSGVYAPAGYPAVTVPSGYRDNGEPYGVTFVGPLCKDLSLLNFAYGYEQGTMYRKNPK